MAEQPVAGIPDGVSPIDWLISLRPEYKNTDLARWEERRSSHFLEEFARLRADYPQHLNIATDYLFEAASFAHFEESSRISRADIGSRSIDRLSSMQGGFPWTDEDHPWPTDGDTDVPTYARPTLQLNLRDLGASLGIELPPVLFQVWEDETPTIIELSEVEGRNPSWDMPDIDAAFRDSPPEPFGWLYITDADDADRDWIGNSISVSGKRTFVLPDMAWCLSDDADHFGEDARVWLEAQFGYSEALEQFVERVVPVLDFSGREEFARRRGEIATLIDQEKEDTQSAEHPHGSFLGEPTRRFVKDVYPELVLSGRRMLYEPKPAPEWNGPGLNFFDDFGVLVTLNHPRSILTAVDREECEPRVDFYTRHAEAG